MSGAKHLPTAPRVNSQRWRRLVHQQPLLFLAVAAIVGVLIDSSFGPPSGIKAAVWIGLLITCVGVILLSRRTSHTVASLATVTLVMAFAALDHLYQDRSYQSASILSIITDRSQPAILEGLVKKPPLLRRHPLADQRVQRDQSPWQTQIEISITRLKIGRDFQSVDGRLLLVIDGRCDNLSPGQALRVYGAMRRIGLPTNPGERSLVEVDRRRGLHGRVDVDSPDQVVELGDPNFGSGLSRSIAWIAGRGRDVLLDQMGDSTGPLAVALVIGQRDFVDRDTRDMLLITGTAHLLSVSGMHLAIVVVLASWAAMLARLPTVPKVIFILAVCAFYTALTGGRPPVMRAAVLVATFMFAIWMRRPSQPINTLSLAALLLVLLNPENVFSIGVQLSFLAVATLVLCSSHGHHESPAFEQAIRQEEQLQTLADSARSPVMYYLRRFVQIVGQLVWFSACVTAISIPLVWHQFHIVSLISVVTNVLLGPLLFVALASGIATVIVGIVCPPLTVIPGVLCDLSLQLMRGVISWATSVPAGHFWLPAPPTWWVVMFYLTVGLTLAIPFGHLARSLRYGWIGLWVLVAIGLATQKPPLQAGSTEATFVDVGHGTSVVLRFAENDVWLYDCGRLGNDRGSSRDIDATLWALGVTRLRGIILSHADADHFNALPGLLRRFSVTQIVTPPGMLDEPEPALHAIRRAIENSSVVVKELSAGYALKTSTTAMRILHPPRARLPASDNANSLVLRIDCGGKPLVLPGDLEPPGTDLLIRHDRPPPGGALMAPHHGSLRMDAAAVLQWSRPSETVVSGGGRARRPEVREMLEASGSGVHVTAEVGAVRVLIDRDGKVQVRSWLRSPW